MKYNRKLHNYFVFFSIFYLTPYTIDFLYVFFTKNLLSDFTIYHIQTNLDVISLLFVYFHGIIYYFLGILLFFFIQNHLYNFSYYVKYKRKLFYCFLIGAFLLQAFFSYKFKIGSAGGHGGNKFSMFMNLLSLDTLFYVYYCIYRDKITKKFIFLVLLYFGVKIIQGWSGFILSFFLVELYYRYLRSDLKRSFFLWIPIFILGGSVLYQFMYPLKTFIRIGEYVKITYVEAIIKLVTRISCFSNSCVAYEYLDEMLHLNATYSRENAELLYYFNTILPSFIYDKSFQPLNTLLLKARFVSGGFSNFDLGSVYYLLLWKISKLDYILYFSIVIINSFFFRIFLQIISQKDRYIWFVFITYYCSIFLFGNALNMLSTWIVTIFSFMFMFSIGIVKIYKRMPCTLQLMECT